MDAKEFAAFMKIFLVALIRPIRLRKRPSRTQNILNRRQFRPIKPIRLIAQKLSKDIQITLSLYSHDHYIFFHNFINILSSQYLYDHNVICIFQ